MTTPGSPPRGNMHGPRLQVTFVGFESFWMDVLAHAISERYSDEIHCTWMPWPSTVRERVRFMVKVLRGGVIVRVGMPFEFESETNRLWLTLLRIIPWLHGVNYWVGSDVLPYLERVASSTTTARDQAAARLMTHFAGSEHLRAELADAGIEARTVVFPSPERDIPAQAPPLPAHFSVLAYLHEPQERFEFYGGPAIFAAARALPDTSFLVVGSADPAARELPGNVRYLGRVGDMDRVYEQTAVLVRLVCHDGVPSAMVEEAMVYGRYVVYSFDWPHTEFVAFGDEERLIGVLRDLHDRFAAGALPLNSAGRAFTIEDWNPDRRAALIRAALLEAAGRG